MLVWIYSDTHPTHRKRRRRFLTESNKRKRESPTNTNRPTIQKDAQVCRTCFAEIFVGVARRGRAVYGRPLSASVVRRRGFVCFEAAAAAAPASFRRIFSSILSFQTSNRNPQPPPTTAANPRCTTHTDLPECQFNQHRQLHPASRSPAHFTRLRKDDDGRWWRSARTTWTGAAGPAARRLAAAAGLPHGRPAPAAGTPGRPHRRAAPFAAGRPWWTWRRRWHGRSSWRATAIA